MALMLTRSGWAREPRRWIGHFAVLYFSSDEPGAGPRLHRHPCDEVFVIRRGRDLFLLGDERIEAGEGDLLLAPAGTAHRFETLEPGRLETTDIHPGETWLQEDPG